MPGGQGRECAHLEGLQVYPIITKQKPYVTGNSKATCGTASGNSGVGILKMESIVIANITTFTLAVVVSILNRQCMVKNLRSNTNELYVE